MTNTSAALLANLYASTHQLRRVTIAVTDLGTNQCVVDYFTNTIHIRPGLSLSTVTALIRAAVELLCRGFTVVIDEDDGSVEWSACPTATGDFAPTPRPQLRLVPQPE